MFYIVLSRGNFKIKKEDNMILVCEISSPKLHWQKNSTSIRYRAKHVEVKVVCLTVWRTTTERWPRCPALRITSSRQKERFVFISHFCAHPKQALNMWEIRVNLEAKVCSMELLRGCVSKNLKTSMAASII